MKREILYKAQRADGTGWVVGQYYYDLNSSHTIVVTSHYSGDGRTEPPSDYQEHIAIIPETLCQFTGLTDKNGTKIFEGDILRGELEYADDEGNAIIDMTETNKDTVLFETDHHGQGSGFITHNITQNWNECEVISNIHDKNQQL